MIFLDKNKLNSRKKDAAQMPLLLNELELLQPTMKKAVRDWMKSMPKHIQESWSQGFEQGYEQIYPLLQAQISLLKELSENFNTAIQLAERPRGKITLSNGIPEFDNDQDLEIYEKTKDKILETIQAVVENEERQNEKVNRMRNLK